MRGVREERHGASFASQIHENWTGRSAQRATVPLDPWLFYDEQVADDRETHVKAAEFWTYPKNSMADERPDRARID